MASRTDISVFKGLGPVISGRKYQFLVYFLALSYRNLRGILTRKNQSTLYRLESTLYSAYGRNPTLLIYLQVFSVKLNNCTGSSASANDKKTSSQNICKHELCKQSLLGLIQFSLWLATSDFNGKTNTDRIHQKAGMITGSMDNNQKPSGAKRQNTGSAYNAGQLAEYLNYRSFST